MNRTFTDEPPLVPGRELPAYYDKRNPQPSKASLARAYPTKTDQARAKCITTGELCDATGLTRTELRKLINRGVIRSSARNSANYALFDSGCIQQIKRIMRNRLGVVSRREGLFADQCEYTTEESLRVIELLNKGMSAAEIVVKVKAHPVIVMSIRRDWARMHGGLWVDLDILEEINKLPLEGTFPITSAKELYDVLWYASRDRKCGQCPKGRERPITNLCLACAKKSFYAARKAARERDAEAEAEEEG